jgi:hypothetical protein
MPLKVSQSVDQKSRKESMDVNSDLVDNLNGDTDMKANLKLIETKVFSAIFEDTVSTGATGVSAYNVVLRYNTPESDVIKQATVGVRAGSPEEAKSQAVASCAQMGYTNVSVQDVNIVGDTAGSGNATRPADKPTASLNLTPGVLDGLKGPSDVSPSLSNSGVILPKHG